MLIIARIIAFFAGLPRNVLLGGLIVLALLLGYFMLVRHYESVGAADAIDKIDQQNKGAIDAASDARSKRRACTDAGGVWDTSSGKCGSGVQDLPAP